MVGQTTTQPATLIQLRRIQGQLAGVIAMSEAGRPCIEVTRQIVAVRNSLGRVARDMLNDEAHCCSRDQRIDELELVVKELFKYE